MSDVVDLSAERNRREQPDPGCIRHDDYGQPLYLFALGYDYKGGSWSAEIWAYSLEDAQRRVAAMCCSLQLRGQVFSVIPA